jgi:RNA polymerase sigma factor for flagellar operon FliA
MEGRFLSALPDIEQTIRFIGRRNRLSASEQEDFASEVKLALIENDYAVLARFEGRSSLRTYLVTVIQRLFLDYRRRLWGKWHPSAEALRLGPLALRLEMLVYRDGYSASEACELVRTNLAVGESREALMEVLGRLPARQRGQAQPSIDNEDRTEFVANLPASELTNPHVALQASETATRCQSAIEHALEELPADDRILLRLRFVDDVSVADIARSFRLDQKRLYRRIDSLLGDLRRSLEAAGLSWDDVRQLIDRGHCHLRLPPEKHPIGGENPPSRPSPLRATS